MDSGMAFMDISSPVSDVMGRIVSTAPDGAGFVASVELPEAVFADPAAVFEWLLQPASRIQASRIQSRRFIEYSFHVASTTMTVAASAAKTSAEPSVSFL